MSASGGNDVSTSPRSRVLRLLAPLLLALVVLAPYHRLLVGSAIPIPDDISISDLADADFPLRVEAGRIVRGGELPLWTSGVYCGMPLQALDPISLALFTALPPALALGWFLAAWILAAALGTYALARQIGANRPGSFLAGVAFAWSGFIVCQLRHPAALEVVSLFPAAVLCLERAAGGELDASAARALPLLRRLRWLAGFAALFGLQLLAGFPQSAYNASLVYAALVAARCGWLLRARGGEPAGPAVAGLALGALAALALAALVGMAQLLPLRELGELSDRSGGGTYAWATRLNYWPRNALTFLFPYANGDISDLNYSGPGLFWEDYGYVGLTTLLLALGALATRFKRFAVVFWGGAGLGAFGLVLGSATPLFGIAFEVLPGLSTFRLPTRFLFIVELALALLGGLGLTALTELLARRLRGRAREIVPPLVAAAFATVTAADLVYHHRRQNPLVEADLWLRKPASAAAILERGPQWRVYSPGNKELHSAAFSRARGWAGDLTPYVEHRDFLQPDANLLHGVAALDGYTGIASRWTVDLVGDHNRRGIIAGLHRPQRLRLHTAPGFFNLLEALSVGWVILPFRASGERMAHVARVGTAELHRLPGALPRARVVDRARVLVSADEFLARLQDGSVDLRREAVLRDPAAAATVDGLARAAAGATAAGDARLLVDRATEVVVDAVAPHGGLLLLADTWYPGWEATVDGHPAPVYLANLAHRAVPLPPGSHRVTFVYRPRSVLFGLALSAVGIGILIGAAAWLARCEQVARGRLGRDRSTGEDGDHDVRRG